MGGYECCTLTMEDRMSGEQPADPYTHWRRRAETAESRVHELEFEVQRLNMEMEAYRQPLTAKDSAAMLSVIDALQTEKASRPLKHAPWFDGGYLNNGHCSFMWERNGEGACCQLAHGHEGPHQDGLQSSAVLWEGPGIIYPCGCQSAGPDRRPPWYCDEHNQASRPDTAE
jgi:hypothetical protein